MEIELKLRIKSNETKHAKRLLTRAAGSSGRSVPLVATYYDTSDRTLLEAGYTFRVRRENGTYIQTLKHADPLGSDALHRHEWADTIAQPAPDLSAPHCGLRLRRKFKKLAVRQQFKVDVRRHAFQIARTGDVQIEAVVDQGTIRRKRTTVSLNEIELELKSGPVAAIYALALEIAPEVQFQIEPLSKAEQGYGLASGARPVAVRMEAPHFTEGQTIAETLIRAARRYFAHYYRNMPAMIAGDADGIHQMRVAVRRLRSVLSAMRDYVPKNAYGTVNDKLKQIQQSLGDTRDLDVLIDRVGRTPSVRLRRTVAHHRMVKMLQIRRQRALNVAQKTASSHTQAVTWLRVMHWFESLGDSASKKPRLKKHLKSEVPKILDRLLARVRKRARHFSKLPPAEQHRVRIACKKLRYAIDLFASLYKKHDVEHFLKCLKVVQDELGALNDAHVARRLLMNSAPPKTVAVTAGETLGWIEREAGTLPPKTARHLRRVLDSKPFW